MSHTVSRHAGSDRLWVAELLTDLVSLALSYGLTLVLRFHSGFGERMFRVFNRFLGEGTPLLEEFESFYVVSAPRILAQIALPLLLLYALNDLYPGRRFVRPRNVAGRMFLANLGVLGLIYGYLYLSRNIFHPRSIFVTVLVLNGLLNGGLRAALNRMRRWARTRFAADLHSVVIAGAGEGSARVRQWLTARQPHGLTFAAEVPRAAGEGVEDWLQRARAEAERAGADTLVCAEAHLSVADTMRFIETAGDLNAVAKVLSRHMDVLRLQAGVPTDLILGVPMAHFPPPRRSGPAFAVRLAVERCAAALALALCAPLLALIAAAIRLTSRGPVFFVQDRIGINRVPFRMLKFRTMHDGAEEQQASMEEFNESPDVVFKMRRDPRVTPVGRFLRRFSLDELPQLLNVLRGEMALVGPRPLPRRDFAGYYEQWHYGRHDGLPGLTCLWQVSGRSEIDFQNMCLLDVYYLRNQGWILDLKLLMRSAWVVLFGRGAY